jgi:hypothetical protein
MRRSKKDKISMIKSWLIESLMEKIIHGANSDRDAESLSVKSQVRYSRMRKLQMRKLQMRKLQMRKLQMRKLQMRKLQMRRLQMTKLQMTKLQKNCK